MKTAPTLRIRTDHVQVVDLRRIFLIAVRKPCSCLVQGTSCTGLGSKLPFPSVRYCANNRITKLYYTLQAPNFTVSFEHIST